MNASARSMSDGRDGPDQVDDRLAELGLKREYLERAVWAGVRDRRLTDEFEPATAGGLRDWIGRVRELRRVLVENGWTAVNPANAPFVRRPDGEVLLGVMQGNQYTGRLGGPLESGYPKGTAIESITAGNDDGQYSIAEVDAMLGLRPGRKAKAWFLVTYNEYDEQQRVTRVRWEVSQPAPSTADHKIVSWATRYCMDPIGFDAVIEPDRTVAEPIDVRVAQR